MSSHFLEWVNYCVHGGVVLMSVLCILPLFTGEILEAFPPAPVPGPGWQSPGVSGALCALRHSLCPLPGLLGFPHGDGGGG